MLEITLFNTDRIDHIFEHPVLSYMTPSVSLNCVLCYTFSSHNYLMIHELCTTHG